MEFTYCDLCTGLPTTRKMKSPIEIMFHEEFKMHSDYFKAKYGLCTLDLNPQYPINVDNKTYFVDFSIELMSDDGSYSMSYAIECDGHDFHEKTKEQVAHDKQRERILLNYFSKVIRFSGSEIYNDANKCVQEVLEIIQIDLSLKQNPKQIRSY